MTTTRGFPVWSLRAKRMSCKTAAACARKLKFTRKGQPRLRGFKCRGHRSLQDGVAFRCSRKRAKLQFYVGG